MVFIFENINLFNIEIAIKKVMNVYNKSLHKTIKFIPNEVFYNNNANFIKLYLIIWNIIKN